MNLPHTLSSYMGELIDNNAACGVSPYASKVSPFGEKDSPYASKVSPFGGASFCPVLIQEDGFALLNENGGMIEL